MQIRHVKKGTIQIGNHNKKINVKNPDLQILGCIWEVRSK